MVGVGACVCVCASSSYCCIVVFVGAMPLLIFVATCVSALFRVCVSVLYFGLWDICGYFALFGFVSVLYFGLRDIVATCVCALFRGCVCALFRIMLM